MNETRKRPEGSTYLDHTIANALNERGGRYAREVPTFPGANVYPKQPDTSPWSQGGAVPPEPPYPVDINFVPPVGEFHERADGSPSSPLQPAVTKDAVPDVPGVHHSPPVEHRAPTQEEIDDEWTGERRADQVPLGNPMGLPKRRPA
jgi:hypothetical protein